MRMAWEAGPLMLVRPTLIGVLQARSADTRMGVAVGGLLLLAVEANRPGWVVPGATGLCFVLLAVASFVGQPITWWAVLLLVACLAVLGCNVWRRVPGWVLSTATFGMICGLKELVPAKAFSRVSLPTAVFGGLIIGAGASVLSRMAFRARDAKRVH